MKILKKFVLCIIVLSYGCSAALVNIPTVPNTRTDAAVITVDVAGPVQPDIPNPDSLPPPNLSPTGNNGERIAPLRLGQPAPFSGVLFNGAATAWLEVEFRTQQQRCVIDRQHDRDLMAARYTLDMDTLRNALTTQRNFDQVLLGNLDASIASQNRVIDQLRRSQNSFTRDLMFFSIGVGAGILTAGLVGSIILLTR